MHYETYQNPLSERYASKKMQEIFSSATKFRLWRTLWVVLAESQQALGLPITLSQIAEMKAEINHLNLDRAVQLEKELNHDVMAHIQAFGELCPSAKPIIHLGATSCYVTDNTDIILMRNGLKLLTEKLKKVILQLSVFAQTHAFQACLGYTHFQPAQPTTVGKRACLWIQDLLMDYKEIIYRTQQLKLLGTKGATGTQASYLNLFGGNEEKVRELDELVAKKMGFESSFSISGQTYTRKLDMHVISALAGIGASAHKFASDIRLLAHLKEVEEPFSLNQVGSSAMPYKRNPILSERICGLARYLLSLNENPAYTASTQWLERTLDDSSNRRIVIPEAFLTCDAILNLLETITAGLTLNPYVINRHLEEELIFIATENILMEAVKKGGDRQVLHEKLRQYCIDAAQKIKKSGEKKDLLDVILHDSTFNLTKNDLDNLLKCSNFAGRAPQQVEEFLKNEVFPGLA